MLRKSSLVALCYLALTGSIRADDVYPLAQLPFEERGASVEGLGDKVNDLLFAKLIVEPDVFMVDRENLDGVLKELELNLSGAVNANQAAQVGQLTGAKLLLTGSVFQIGTKIYLVVKIIGTETTRVAGVSVNAGIRHDLDPLVSNLAKQIVQTLENKADELVAQPKTPEDHLAAIKEEIKREDLPKLSVHITERHVGQITIDPAAETEISMLAEQSGFELLDVASGEGGRADVVLAGEALSEFASRQGNLVSVKARVEVKATDVKTGEVIAIDRQTAVAVDLAEQIAAKAALQRAAAEIAVRMLPKLTGAGTEATEQDTAQAQDTPQTGEQAQTGQQGAEKQ